MTAVISSPEPGADSTAIGRVLGGGGNEEGISRWNNEPLRRIETEVCHVADGSLEERLEAVVRYPKALVGAIDTASVLRETCGGRFTVFRSLFRVSQIVSKLANMVLQFIDTLLCEPTLHILRFSKPCFRCASTFLGLANGCLNRFANSFAGIVRRMVDDDRRLAVTSFFQLSRKLFVLAKKGKRPLCYSGSKLPRSAPHLADVALEPLHVRFRSCSSERDAVDGLGKVADLLGEQVLPVRVFPLKRLMLTPNDARRREDDEHEQRQRKIAVSESALTVYERILLPLRRLTKLADLLLKARCSREGFSAILASRVRRGRGRWRGCRRSDSRRCDGRRNKSCEEHASSLNGHDIGVSASLWNEREEIRTASTRLTCRTNAARTCLVRHPASKLEPSAFTVVADHVCNRDRLAGVLRSDEAVSNRIRHGSKRWTNGAGIQLAPSFRREDGLIGASPVVGEVLFARVLDGVVGTRDARVLRQCCLGEQQAQEKGDGSKQEPHCSVSLT